MNGGNSDESCSSDQISSDSLDVGAVKIEEYCKKELRVLRQKLLDLSKRNKLLNFRHSASAKNQIRIVDEVLEFAFDRLKTGSKFEISPLPDPKEKDFEPEDEDTPEFRAEFDACKLTDSYKIQKKEINEKFEIGQNPVQFERELQLLDRKNKDLIRTKLGLSKRNTKVLTTPLAWAKKNDISDNYSLNNLDESSPKKHFDNKLQTLLFRKRLEAILEHLNKQSSLSISEKGVHTLYATFGFLEWFDSEHSNHGFFAPLILLPIEISKIFRRGEMVFSIKSIGEPQINETLRIKMKAEGLVLPDAGIDGEFDLNAYLKSIELVVENKIRWKVHRFLTVGLFSFHKIAMYEDLASNSSGPSPHEYDLISSILGGKQSTDGSASDHPSVYNPDELGDIKDLPKLILDADSSQFSAVIDVLEGKNLIIQGPPGTGKSQTISNIIGAALMERKSVLFVSEKLSALEVVKKRLDDCGIGEFCLEVHSSRMNRADFAARLKSRINRDSHHIEIGDNFNYSQLKRTKNRIKRYLELLDQQIGESGISIEEMLWRAQKIEYSQLPVDVRRFRFSQATSVSDETLKSLQESLLKISSIESNLGKKVSESIWYGFKFNGASSHVASDILDLIEESLSACIELRRIRQVLASNPHVSLADDTSKIHDDLGLIQGLSPIQSLAEFTSLYNASRKSDVERRYDKICGLKTDLEILTQEFSGLNSTVGFPMSKEAYEASLACIELCNKYGWESVGELEAFLLSSQGELECIENSKLLFFEAQKIFPELDPSGLVVTIRIIIEILNHIKDFPEHDQVYHSACLVNYEFVDKINGLQLKMRNIVKSLNDFVEAEEINPQVQLSHVRLKEALHELSDNSFLRVFRKKYRSSKKYLNLLNVRDTTERPAIELIGALLPILSQIDKLKNSTVFAEFSIYSNHDENLNLIKRISDWLLEGNKLCDKLPKSIELKFFNGEQYSVLSELSMQIEKIDFSQSLEVLKRSASNGSNTLNDYQNKLYAQIHELKAFCAKHHRWTQFSSISLPELKNLVSKHNKAEENIRLQVETRDLIVEDSKAFGSFLFADLVGAIPMLKTFNAAGFSPANTPIDVDIVDSFLESSRLFRSCYSELSASLKQLKEITGLTSFSMRDDLMALEIDLTQYKNAINELTLIFEWSAHVDEISNSVANDVITLVKAGFSECLANSLETLHALSLHEVATKSYPELIQFSGRSLSKDRETMRSLDRKLSEVSKAQIVRELEDLCSEAPRGIGYGSKRNFTEMSLIRHQTGLTKPSMPPKKIFKKAPESLRKLFPCFMMSPLTVAEYLDRSQWEFDLVVFDEASQIKPEDALGALMRAKQFVVVGDTMQLPPTPFFASNSDVQDEEIDSEEIDEIHAAESVLEKAESTFGPARMLLWHYRSQHPSLIDYSNREFYEERLHIFPAPVSDIHSKGVRSHYVSDGSCVAGRNLPEARLLVRGVIDTIRKQPALSIGIVAMNVQQRDLISELLDLEFINDEQINDYRIKWYDTLSPLFVKNLENVQGDERDIIFISTVYGRDSDGALLQRFGPINQSNGHRRLNVLFTRAKHSIQLYTSLKSGDILIDDKASRGKRVFKEYLEFASSGRLASGSNTLRAPDSEFEVQVSQALRAKGFKCDYQIGVSGFFVDLAVQHPSNPGHYVLGVECDGAKYHSFKSARDRDRLREDALVAKGWKIHRIWSTDWFKNREIEVKRLISAVEDAVVTSITHT